jgi:predicted AAA+ superfamily ATPase
MVSYPAVVLIGARQVGKTTILKQVLPDAKLFDLEDDQDFNLCENDPAIIFKDYPKPIVFDEAQLSKNLFKALRVEIDRTRENGQFLLSGSSSPELLENISETLAGRIAIVEIPCLNFSESHSCKLSTLMEKISNQERIKDLDSLTSTENVFESCLYGGYPLPFLKRKDLDFFDSWFDNYFKTYIERDVRSLFPTLKLDSYKKFIRMLAQSSGDIINFSDFARSLDVSQPTIKKYIEIAEGTFIWRTLTSYTKNPRKTVIKMPKGHLRDSGLLCFLLGIHTIEQLKNHQSFGRIWESFIIEQLIKTAQIYHAKLSYYFYRTKAKAEIDLVLEGRFGLIPIEIKSGVSTTQKQLITLKNFIEENECPFAIVINRGDEIKFLAERVLQIPVNFI